MFNKTFGAELASRRGKIPGYIRTTKKRGLGAKKEEMNYDFYTKRKKWLLNEKKKMKILE
jgi:hypothetical protein